MAAHEKEHRSKYTFNEKGFIYKHFIYTQCLQPEVTSEKVHSSICHVEGAAPLSLRPGGGAVDGEDLPSRLLLATFCCAVRVHSSPPGAQQPMVHQALPGTTEVRLVEYGGAGGGWSTAAPPDGVARGKDSNSVVPEKKPHKN